LYNGAFDSVDFYDLTKQKVAAMADIHDLLQAHGGLFTTIVRARSGTGVPDFATRIVELGDLGRLGANGWTRPVAGNLARSVTGAGTGLCDEDATLLALAEALERYCTCIYRKEQFIWASGNELGKEALDLNSLPKCSNAEISNPKCPLSVADQNSPIRWVRGLSLLDGRLVYLPVVMIYLYAGYSDAAERFWLPITTGCAVHYSYERAILNAILEVIERDAISIVWLQKLPIPRIEIDHVPDSLASCWARYQRASPDLEYRFFDATLDLEIPTVYGVQISHAERRVTSLVSCATALEPAAAMAKIIRDMAALRIAFRNPRGVPACMDDFRDVFDGATYMARAENIHLFDFLLQNDRKRRLDDMVEPSAPLGRELQFILGRLQKNGLDVYVVDLTTDEAIRCGLRAVRVVIPGLQPMSFHHRARYLGHRRLFEVPKKLGYRVHTEEQLNAWPQPFA
jgi:ribosomal protein S12 methylthiotransferase accessory factor